MRFDLPNFRIDFRDWNKGNNLYDDLPTGGFKRDTTGYNPFKTPGALQSMPTLSETAVTASLKRSPIVAWAPGGNVADFGLIGVGVDAAPLTGGQGYFYFIDEQTGAMTLLYTCHATNYSYKLGQSEAVTYNTGILVSSQKGLTFVNPGTGLNEAAYTGFGLSDFNANVPHPMAYLEDILYIGDLELLHQLDGGTGDSAYFSIPSQFIITALEEHRGYLMIAGSEYYMFQSNITNVKTRTEIFTWPGYGESFVDRFIIPDQVTAMKSADDGRLYVWTIKQFGYFNGLRFVPLRDLENPIYKSQIMLVKNGLMFADGMKMIRYASVVPGGSKYFYVNEVHTKTITALVSGYPSKFTTMLDGGIGNAGRNVLYTDLTASGGTREYEFNPRITKVPVKMRQVVVETDGLGASGVITVKYKNSNGETKDCGTFTYADVKMAAKKRWTFTISGHPSTTQITPLITVGGTAKLLSVDYYYEAAGETNNA